MKLLSLLNWDYIKVKLSKQVSKTLFNCINKLNKNMYMEIKEEISDKVYEDLFNFLIKDITDSHLDALIFYWEERLNKYEGADVVLNIFKKEKEFRNENT